MVMPRVQCRLIVWPESLCGVPGRHMVYTWGAVFTIYKTIRAWDLLCPFSAVLEAGKLIRGPQKSWQTTGTRAVWHMYQRYLLLKTFLKMRHCRDWDVSDIWFQHKEIVLNIFMQMMIVLPCLSGIYVHFFSCIKENIQSSRDSEAS